MRSTSHGWDDPRMSTLSGFRRRGYTPASIRNFCDMVGTNRSDGVVDYGMLEFSIRQDLDANAPRAMCVLRPLKVVITNYPQDQVEHLELPRHPQKEELGVRKLPFAREIYIDRDDFMEEPPKGYKRLEPNGEVRLRGSYVIRADEAIKDADGNIVELRCSYDPETLGKNPEGRKVKGRGALGTGRGQRRVRSAPVRSSVPLAESLRRPKTAPASSTTSTLTPCKYLRVVVPNRLWATHSRKTVSSSSAKATSARISRTRNLVSRYSTVP
jgi:hypothetical protein